MKTKSDLNSIIPAITELLKNNGHEIGESYWEQNEDGWGKCFDSITNYFTYEEGGWLIEATYDCCGDWDGDTLESAWGKITELSAYHYDEDTDEETIFSEDDLMELWSALDKALEKI